MGIVCSICKQVKDRAEFRKSDNKRGFRYSCADCDRKKENEKRASLMITNPEAVREKERKEALKKSYNMSLEDYDNLMKKQNNVCGICKDTCVSGRRLAVDHCHTTGKIRGLLCCNCNRGLGLLKDSKERLAAAIAYLA